MPAALGIDLTETSVGETEENCEEASSERQSTVQGSARSNEMDRPSGKSEAEETSRMNGSPSSSTAASPSGFYRSLSSANFSPDGDLYDTLDEDWLLSSDIGELSLFDFLDSLSNVPVALDRINQRFKSQSREVRAHFPTNRKIWLISVS